MQTTSTGCNTSNVTYADQRFLLKKVEILASSTVQLLATKRHYQRPCIIQGLWALQSVTHSPPGGATVCHALAAGWRYSLSRTRHQVAPQSVMHSPLGGATVCHALATRWRYSLSRTRHRVALQSVTHSPPGGATVCHALATRWRHSLSCTHHQMALQSVT